MDFRLFFTIFTNVLISISHYPPNFENEMGQQNNDKVSQRGKLKYGFIKNMFLQIFLGLLQFHHIMFYNDEPLSIYEWLFVVIGFSGFLLRMWCFYLLGNLFTFSVGIRENHKLITVGPYKYLMHPSYLGQELLLICGVLLLTKSIYIIVPYMCLLLYVIIKRINIEEEVLKNHFGEEFKKYSSVRYRMIPFIY